jgi:hypothetical protein
VQHVEAKRVLTPHWGGDQQLDAGVLDQQRDQIVRRRLDEIDLAVEKGVDLGLRVGDPDPFHAVDLDDLAAGEPRGWLRARLVFRVLEVDRLLAWLPLVLLEDEGAGADRLGDLCVGIGLGDTLGHHEGDVGGRLAERGEHEAVGLLEPHDERLGVHRLQFGDEAHELLAHAVAHAPALQRGDAVLRRHRLAVVPFEPVAQREGPSELVVTYAPRVDHLRFDGELLVERKQRIVDHHAVMGANQRRGPDGIDDLEVGVESHL